MLPPVPTGRRASSSRPSADDGREALSHQGSLVGEQRKIEFEIDAR